MLYVCAYMHLHIYISLSFKVGVLHPYSNISPYFMANNMCHCNSYEEVHT